jgi:hypothetical protein
LDAIATILFMSAVKRVGPWLRQVSDHASNAGVAQHKAKWFDNLIRSEISVAEPTSRYLRSGL